MITSKEFIRRRKQLMRMMGKNSIAIIPTATETIRNRDVEYSFRADSDFYYLSGFSEPDAVAVLIPGRAHGEYLLFCRESDPKMETWTGVRAGTRGAIDSFQADDAFPISDIDEILPGLMESRDRVFYTMGSRPQFDQRVMDWINRLREGVRTGMRTPDKFVSLEHLLHDMRLYKSRSEVRVMRAAARVACHAHISAMQVCQPDIYEYEVEAELLYEFRRAGMVPAYSNIVGGGANGCILHYTENNALLQDGDLLLIDAGAEYDCYASDVHDVGDYKVGNAWRELEAGMVLTVEPGIYIPAGSRGVARKWWDIGIRIEDDVLVTRDAPDVLSKAAPKTVAAIEALMADATV